EETRAALADLDTSLSVYFDNLGSRLLAEGDVAGALAETRRAAAASDHPLHDARWSNVLLTAGLRDAARRVAQAAVAEDPDSAVAHRTLGFVLMHDPAGRRFGVGWERDDAIASLRRATELDPEDTSARHNLAVVLARGDNGELYADGCDLEAAIAEYASLEEAGYDETDGDYLSALFEAGRYAEVAEQAEEMAPSPALRVFQVAAVAQRRGATPALRLVRDLNDGERRNIVATASNKLLTSRNYRPAAELFERLQRGAPNAAQVGALVDLLQVVGNAEEVAVEGEGPEAATQRYYQLLARRDLEGLRRLFEWRGESFAEEMFGEVETLFESPETRKLMRLSGDLVVTALPIEAEGSDEWGHRVKIESPVSPPDTVYLAPAEGGLRLLGVASGGAGLPETWLPGFGRVALDLLAAGELEGARQWLDWAREEVPLFDSEEPLAVSPFARLWQLGNEAGEAEVRRAAAVLMAGGEPAERDEAVVLLEEARRTSDDAEVTRHLELALVGLYQEEERWEEMLASATRLNEAHPDSFLALVWRAAALEELDRRDEVRAIGEARLAEDPDDKAGVAILAVTDRYDGDLAAAARRMRRVSALPDGRWADNDVAWYEVVLGAADEATVESARRAAEGGGRAELHTLATVYAELERPAAARDVLHQMLNLDHEGLQPHDWYVVGRIAESYGERELAKECYERVEPLEEPETGAPVSTHFLAQRRLAALARPG
ncbi:MAG TPA: hypothetical protein VKU40_04850, partial [Thermoanaerobaculia bacterium]|nr:hypothetical protein [Thermoanaerobaculia bacterium]